MGGGHYEGDVAERRRSTARTSGRSFFAYEAQQKSVAPKERKCHKDLDPKGKMRECRDNPDHPLTTPIVCGMDLTPSRGKDADTIVSKMPPFIGQIYLHGYVSDPTFCPIGIGDATCDRAPCQVGQFESDNRIDDGLAKLWREEDGGGGTGEESYQLAAYYGAKHMELDATARGEKGYFFFLGDEAPYDTVSAQEVRRIFGDSLEQDIPTAKIMRELQKKFHTFLIFPGKSMEERKKDIDVEIKKRVEQAGGMHGNVDIRFSLLWHDRNDLDLHVQTPRGEEIYYGNKVASCGGNLDVDMNVRGETTKPVENVRWKRGSAPAGKYRVWVERYSFHEPSNQESPFKVEIYIGGKIEHFEGVIPAQVAHGQSRCKIGDFDYDSQSAVFEEQSDHYANYQDDVVKGKWLKYLPEDHILPLHDANGIVDVMLGVLAIKGGSRDLAGYVKDLEEKGQTPERIADVSKALQKLAESASVSPIAIPKPMAAATGRRRTRRI